MPEAGQRETFTSYYKSQYHRLRESLWIEKFREESQAPLGREEGPLKEKE